MSASMSDTEIGLYSSKWSSWYLR